MRACLTLVVPLILSLSASACGGGTDTAANNEEDSQSNLAAQLDPSMPGLLNASGLQPLLPTPGQLTAPPLIVTAELGKLHFQWHHTAASDRVRLVQLNPLTREIMTLYETRGHLANAWTHTISTPLVDWENTRYALELCNAELCAYSNSVAPADWHSNLAGKISIEGATAYEQSGSSIATTPDASTLVIGAPGASSGSHANAGALNVLFRVGDLWWSDARLQASSSFTDARLGHSVDVSSDGNTIVGGAPSDAGIVDTPGAVYVFERFGEGWSETARLQPVIGSANAFGDQVRISGDGNTLVVGGPQSINNEQQQSGKVWVYQRISSQWRASQTISYSVPAANAQFGRALALSGDAGTLFIGDQAGGGHIHIYSLSLGQYFLSTTLRNDRNRTLRFADVISTDYSGAVLVTSLAPGIGAAAGQSPARALVYIRQDDKVWTLAQRLKPSGLQSRTPALTVSNSADANIISIGLVSPSNIGNSVTTFSRQYRQGSGPFWGQISTLNDPQPTLSGYAQSIAHSGDGQIMLVGAPLLDGESLPGTGGVFQY